MFANGIGAWLKTWGLWILAGLSAVAYVIFRWASRPADKGSLIHRAHKSAERKWEEADKRLEEHTEKMQGRRDELKEIKLIEDESERLRRLAEFSNRQRPR